VKKRATPAIWRRASSAIVILVLAGCSSTGSPSSQGAGQGSGAAPATTAATPTSPPSQAASTTAPSPTVAPKVAPSMAIEPALATIWEKAGPANGRKWTGTPEVDPDGKIWASEPFDNVFWIFDGDGKYLESWGTPGRGDGQLTLSADGNGYGDIAFDANGGFYVADSGNARVEQFDKNRKFVRSWGSFGTEDGQFTLPIDIALDTAGHVYVYDGSRFDVQEFGADGSFVRTAARYVGPYFDVDADGNVIAATSQDASVVMRSFARDGTISWALDLSSVLGFATGIDILPGGEILVASSTTGDSTFEYENLLELDSTGKLLHLWPNGGEGIAVDQEGRRLYETFSDKTPVVRALTLPAK
jgi:hypothetical protein